MLETPAGELSSEETTTLLWDYDLSPLIRYAVKEVDQYPTLPAVQVRRTLYSQTPDAFDMSHLGHSGTSPHLHQDADGDLQDIFGHPPKC